MAIYCGVCGERQGFPMSSIRSSRAPCDYCGGYNEYRARDVRTGRETMRRLPNYSYPSRLLPGVMEQEDRAEIADA